MAHRRQKKPTVPDPSRGKGQRLLRRVAEKVMYRNLEALVGRAIEIASPESVPQDLLATLNRELSQELADAQLGGDILLPEPVARFVYAGYDLFVQDVEDILFERRFWMSSLSGEGVNIGTFQVTDIIYYI